MDPALHLVRIRYETESQARNHSKYELNELCGKLAVLHYHAFNQSDGSHENTRFGSRVCVPDDKRSFLEKFLGYREGCCDPSERPVVESRGWEFFGLTSDYGPIHPLVEVYKESGRVQGIIGQDPTVETLKFNCTSRNDPTRTLLLSRWDTRGRTTNGGGQEFGRRMHLIHSVTNERTFTVAMDHQFTRKYGGEPGEQVPTANCPGPCGTDTLFCHPRIFVNGKEVLNDMTERCSVLRPGVEPLWSSPIFAALAPELESLVTTMECFERAAAMKLIESLKAKEDNALKRLRDAEMR
jgi:hypothetical protein